MQNLILFILASCLSIIPVENRHIPIENRHACSLQKKISYTLNSAQKVNVEFAQPKNHTSYLRNPKSEIRNPFFSVSITDWETDEIFVDKLDINFTYKPEKPQKPVSTHQNQKSKIKNPITTQASKNSKLANSLTRNLSIYKTTFTIVITDESLEEKLSEIQDFQLSQVLIAPNKIKLYGNINIGFGALLPAVISGKLFVDNNTEIHFEPLATRIFDFPLPAKLSFIIRNAVNPLFDVENIDIDYADVENFEEKFGGAPQVKIKKVSLLKDCIKIFGETM